MKTKITIITLLFVLLNSSFLILNSYSQWEPDVRLTNGPGDSFSKNNNTRCIAANGNVVHTIWVNERDSKYEIYYKRSTDGGVTWGEDTRLTNDTAGKYPPYIAVSGSNVYISWADVRDGNMKIYYKRSTDSGITWEADTRLANITAQSYSPQIAVSGSNVNVVWSAMQNDRMDIYYICSKDGGISWEEVTQLTNNKSFNDEPSIAVSGSNVHIVWNAESGLYYKLSTDSGKTWGADTRLTKNPGRSLSPSPSIAVSGSNVHIVWFDKRDGNFEIYYKRSTDGGITWRTDTRLTNNNADSEYPSIEVTGSVVHIVWHDNRDGNYEIYYKRSTDGGITWRTDTRLTSNTAQSNYPSIAVSGSFVNIVWEDWRDGNCEIYYKRNPTGNIEAVSRENDNKSQNKWSNVLKDAQKAFAEGKYLLVIELLKDFPIDNPHYFEAVALMNQALDKLPRNSNQSFVTVSGRINCGCSKAISGYVVFEDINTRLNVGRCGITSDGYYCIVLPTGKTYSYYIDSKDFYPLSRIIDFTSSAQALNYKDNITLVSYEEMKEQQVSVRINNIFFDFNESKLKSESYLELDRLYNFLKDNPEIKVEISGHTDNVGSDSYNITLSDARANAVNDYLVSKGINTSRIISKGYGKSNPVASNDTEEGRQLNRRVEFKILKK